MKSFSINIELTCNELISESKILQAFGVVQYPIYCFHCNIVSEEPYPLESLDRGIVECLIQFPEIDINRIATFLGVDLDLIKSRLEDLLNHLEIDKNNDNYYANERSKLFLTTTKGKIKRRYRRDFYLNGHNLYPLPTPFYKEMRQLMIDEEDKYYITDNKGNRIAVENFRPDTVYKIPEIEDVKNNILNFPIEQRAEYEIPESLIEIGDFTFTKLTLPILVAMSLDSKGDLIYDFFNPAIHYPTKIIEKSILKTLKDTCCNFAVKIDVKNSIDEKGNPYSRAVFYKNEFIRKGTNSNDIYFEIRNSIFKDILKLQYGLEDASFKIESNNMLEVWIEEKNISNINRLSRLKILKNLKRSRDYFYSNPISGVWLVFLFFNTNCQNLEEKRNLYEVLLSDWDDNMMKYVENDFQKNRDTLYLHGDYLKLEQLDIAKYMTTFK